MKSFCEKYQENLSALLDKQLSRKETAETLIHVKKCARCQDLYERMCTLQLKIQTELVSPVIPDDIARRLFLQVLSRRKKKADLLTILQQKIESLFSKRWIFAAEFAFVFCLAIFAGIKLYPYLYRTEQQPSLSPKIYTASQHTVESSMSDFIEKSSTVLLQIKNADSGTCYEQEQKMAAELVVKSKLVSQTIDHKNIPYFNDLLNDLEPVFIDIAHLDQPSLGVVQKAIDNKELILKLAFVKSLNNKVMQK
jgi:hypothetical protein